MYAVVPGKKYKTMVTMSSTAYANMIKLGVLFRLNNQDIMREALKQMYSNTCGGDRVKL